jgi:hypothetical protein
MVDAGISLIKYIVAIGCASFLIYFHKLANAVDPAGLSRLAIPTIFGA